MKKYKTIVILLGIIILNSCSYVHYQMHEVKTSNNANDSLMTFKSKGIQITYNFWSNNDNYSCIVENTTDSIITIDLQTSHFIYNKFATPYFNNQSISVSRSNNKAEALGKYTGNSETQITTQEKTMILPPKSMKKLPSFNLLNNYLNCDLLQKQNISSMSFDQTNTPIKFSNFIFYKLGNQASWQATQNDFWVSKIYNILESKFKEAVPQINCGRKTGFDTYQFIYNRSNRYYFKANYIELN